MATESVAVKGASQPFRPEDIYKDDSPYERVCARLNGLNALSVVAQCSLDSPGGPPTKKVWEPLWYFVGLVCQDMQRDMEQMMQERRAEKLQASPSNH